MHPIDKTFLILLYDPFVSHHPRVDFALARIYSDWRDETKKLPGFAEALDKLESPAAWGIFALSWDHFSRPRRREQLYYITLTIKAELLCSAP